MCGVTEAPVRAEPKPILVHPRKSDPAAVPSGEPRNQLEYIEQSRQAHSYSKAVQKLFDMALSYMPDAEKGNAEGRRKAAWSTGLMEAPLLYACDTIPMAVYDLGRLTAAEDAADLANDLFDMPKETCSMVGTLLGEWYMRRNNSVKKVVALSTICEPLNMGYEMIREFGFDIHRVDQVIRPVHGGEERLNEMVKYLVSELEDVAVFLTGKPVDEARMRLEIKRLNRCMAKFRQILKLRVGNPLYIKSLPVLFLLMGSARLRAFSLGQDRAAHLGRRARARIWRLQGGGRLGWRASLVVHPEPLRPDLERGHSAPRSHGALHPRLLRHRLAGQPDQVHREDDRGNRFERDVLLHVHRLPLRRHARRALPQSLPPEGRAELVPGGELAGGGTVGTTSYPRARVRRDALLGRSVEAEAQMAAIVLDSEQMEAMKW